MPSALREIQPNRGYARQDNYRGCNLQQPGGCPHRKNIANLRPASRKWNRPYADNFLSEVTWRLNFTKFRSDGVVRSALLAHPFCKFRIASSMRQRFFKSGIAVINWPAIKEQPLFGFARIHLLWLDGCLASVKR